MERAAAKYVRAARARRPWGGRSGREVCARHGYDGRGAGARRGC